MDDTNLLNDETGSRVRAFKKECQGDAEDVANAADTTGVAGGQGGTCDMAITGADTTTCKTELFG